MKIVKINPPHGDGRWISGEAVSTRGREWRFLADIDGENVCGCQMHDSRYDTSDYELWRCVYTAVPVALRRAVREAVRS